MYFLGVIFLMWITHQFTADVSLFSRTVDLKTKTINGGSYLSLNCSTVCLELPPFSKARRVFKSFLPVHMSPHENAKTIEKR